MKLRSVIQKEDKYEKPKNIGKTILSVALLILLFRLAWSIQKWTSVIAIVVFFLVMGILIYFIRRNTDE